MTHGLASIFVNNQRVEDLDNPELRIRDIIQAYGRDPERCIVYRLESEDESAGDRVDLNERVDLSEIQGALYLRCETRRTEAMAPSPEGVAAEAGDEELMEFEQVPEYEGTLDPPSALDQQDEVPQEELLSPSVGETHAEGDPSGHQFYEREPGPQWNASEKESVKPANEKPSALGSEIRNPPEGSTRPQPRRGGRARRARASDTKPSPTPTRTSPARRKNKEGAAGRRSQR